MIIILTGASGAEKTTICESLEKSFPNLADIFFFDSIGVPSDEEMLDKYGSAENWQKIIALSWFEKLANKHANRPVILEGQIRPILISECCRLCNLKSYKVILIDCSDKDRKNRLIHNRSQPNLANTKMINWAQTMRDEASQLGYKIIDTSSTSLEEAVIDLKSNLLFK